MKKNLPGIIKIIFVICLVLLPLGNSLGQVAGSRLSLSDSLTVKMAEKIKLYPVPVKAELRVENISGVTMIEIFDVTGNKFRNEVCDNQDQITIPVAELRRGIYFIKFITPKATLLKRFIKE
jgi:hypothetical protein